MKYKGGNKNNNLNQIKPIPYDIKIFSFLAIIGILFRVIFGNTTKDFATSTIYGYGFSLFASFGLLFSAFAFFNKEQDSQGFFGFFNVIFKNAFPILLTITIILLIVIQNINYYKPINEGKVAKEYFSYTGISTFLILVQISLMIKFLFDKLQSITYSSSIQGEIMGLIAKQLTLLIIVTSIFNFAFIGILEVILKYFSTDG